MKKREAYIRKRVRLNEATGCWEWVSARDKDGYGVGYLRGKILKMHRASYEFFHNEKIPENMQVCHTCDNPCCCNPDHLFIGTNQENVTDRHTKKRDATGEAHGRSRLTAKQVNEIRELYEKDKIPQREIALRYGISKSTVGQIVRGETWTEPQEPKRGSGVVSNEVESEKEDNND